MSFTTEEKCAVFDKIAQQYFVRNFGSMSKSDLETLLFSEYIEHGIRNGKPVDDYSLSKELGITQSRIRSLKERKELKYPYSSFNWENAFAEAVKNAKYDANEHCVKMIIQDVSVMNEVRNFIEREGWYDECSLNKKLLKIPLDCFVEIFYQNTGFDGVFSKEVKERIKGIANVEQPSVKEFLTNFTKEGLQTFLMTATDEVITEVVKLLPFGGLAKTAFDFLWKRIK